MKIYVCHSLNSDYKNELYAPIRNSELNSHHEFILPHENMETPFNSKELFISKTCDLVIAEVSYSSTGQGIELGWANMLGIPVVCLYKDGTTPARSLSAVSSKLLMYTSIENMIEDIAGVVRQYE